MAELSVRWQREWSDPMRPLIHRYFENESSREYEKSVATALGHALAEVFRRPVAVHHDQKYTGKSGHTHQIDVSAEIEIAGCRILIVVECKRYARNVGVDDVLEFAGRLDDIAAHKGIVVASSGFQSGAETLAKSKGIALAVYRPREHTRPVLVVLEQDSTPDRLASLLRSQERLRTKVILPEDDSQCRNPLAEPLGLDTQRPTESDRSSTHIYDPESRDFQPVLQRLIAMEGSPWLLLKRFLAETTDCELLKQVDRSFEKEH